MKLTATIINTNGTQIHISFFFILFLILNKTLHIIKLYTYIIYKIFKKVKKVATFLWQHLIYVILQFYLYFSFNLAIFSAFSLALAASRSALISSLVFTTSLTSSFSSSFLAFLSTSAIILTTTSLLRSL